MVRPSNRGAAGATQSKCSTQVTRKLLAVDERVWLGRDVDLEELVTAGPSGILDQVAHTVTLACKSRCGRGESAYLVQLMR
jgi:hypothetical protein